MIIKDAGMRGQYCAFNGCIPNIQRSSFIEIEQYLTGFASPELKIRNLHRASAHINNHGSITCYVELQAIGISQICSGQMNDIIGIRSVDGDLPVFFYKRLCLRQSG
ncbi:hypothetical protein A3849_02070 [Paenibacillus sp. P46E]|nr:hypothetical protein A3849_02070 [Paenibacillus sp. P46E]